MNGPNEQRRLRVIVLMGGDSPERKISLLTGKAVQAALQANGHDAEARDIASVAAVMEMSDLHGADLVFPALHGGFGEDGHLQALLDIMDIPYALSGPAASALAMDKAAAKRFMRGAGIPTPEWLLVTNRPSAPAPDPARIAARAGAELNWPLVVKPNCDGSSVGVRIVQRPSEFAEAFTAVAAVGQDILLETFIPGRELTMAVFLGRPLPLLEIRPRTGFYDFENKYTDGASEYLCPAPVHSPVYERIAEDARRVYDLLGCKGVARVDFRLDGATYSCLEVNTIPGMTANSLVPKAAAAVGIGFPALIEDLCRDGIRRHRPRSQPGA
jgi:D-alanine--D-alanine ligase